MASDYPCETFARTTYRAGWVYIRHPDGRYLSSSGWRGEDPQWSEEVGLLLSRQDAQRIDAGLTRAGIVTSFVGGDPCDGPAAAGPPVMIWRGERSDRRAVSGGGIAAAMGGDGR